MRTDPYQSGANTRCIATIRRCIVWIFLLGYLGLKLDDPSFTAPIYANLFDDEDGKSFSLIWSRQGRRD